MSEGIQKMLMSSAGAISVLIAAQCLQYAPWNKPQRQGMPSSQVQYHQPQNPNAGWEQRQGQWNREADSLNMRR